MTTTPTPTLRKAAVLIRSLDAESAAVLLSQLSRKEAKAVRQAIRELGDVDPDEQEELRKALRKVDPRDELTSNAGVEIAFSSDVTEPSTIDTVPPTTEVASAPSHPTNQPFGWLEGGDMPSLAMMLEREHLSTVAVVLSHLPPDRASAVLSALPPNRRAAAIERLADLGESDRASLEVIERELADWITAQKAERQRRADRLRSIQAILRHSSQGTCESVLAEIAAHDASLAGEIGAVRSPIAGPPSTSPTRQVGGQAAALKEPNAKPPRVPRHSATAATPTPAPPQKVPTPPTFDFERLTELNDRQLAELFRNCTGNCVVLALAGASERVTRHVETRLPKGIVRELRRRMLALSAVRLSDFSAAQEEVTRTASRLFGTHPM